MHLPKLTAIASLSRSSRNNARFVDAGYPAIAPMSHKMGTKKVSVKVTYRDGTTDQSETITLELGKGRLHHPSEYQDEEAICYDACHEIKTDLQNQGYTRVKCVGCSVFTKKG